jgi:hypothetical protein
VFALLISLLHKPCQLAICLLLKNFPDQKTYFHGLIQPWHHAGAFMMSVLHCIGAASETAVARGFC